MKRLGFALGLAGILLTLSVFPAQARVTPPKLYPFHAYQGAVTLDCVQVNGAGPYHCNGGYAAPLTDAKVIRSFSGGSTVTYYHQAVSCVDSNGNYYGKWSCSWSLTGTGAVLPTGTSRSNWW